MSALRPMLRLSSVLVGSSRRLSPSPSPHSSWERATSTSTFSISRDTTPFPSPRSSLSEASSAPCWHSGYGYARVSQHKPAQERSVVQKGTEHFHVKHPVFGSKEASSGSRNGDGLRRGRYWGSDRLPPRQSRLLLYLAQRHCSPGRMGSLHR